MVVEIVSLGAAVALIARALASRKRARVGEMPEVHVVGEKIPVVVLPRAPRTTIKGTNSYTEGPHEFVATFGPMLRTVEIMFGFAKGIMIGHAGGETGWGSSVVDMNLFNIKAIGGSGRYWDGSRARGPGGTYRVYSSFTQSALDYVNLISTSARYARAWAERGNVRSYFDMLFACGYFEDLRAVSMFKSTTGTSARLVVS